MVNASVSRMVTDFQAMVKSIDFPDLKLINLQSLAEYKKGLSARGGTTPMRRALPISQTQFYKILHRIPRPLQLPFYVQWKISARWSDIQHLTNQRMFVILPNLVCVNLNFLTKNSTGSDQRIDHYPIVMEVNHPIWMQQLLNFISLPKKTKLTTATTKQVDAIWRNIPVAEMDKQKYRSDTTLMDHYSSYSPRRGSLDVLSELMAAKMITPQQVSIAARHKLPAHQQLTTLAPNTTRYLTHPENAMLHLDMHKVTSLL